MNLEEKMKVYREQTQVSLREEKIADIVRMAKEDFYEREQERLLTYWEFLWTQFRLVQKKWWLLQILLLTVVGITLPSVALQGEYFVQRSMGVAGVLFVVLIIPELWKNRSSQCMEIEASSYYSLRQIYAARILLFGIIDTLLLTIFCGVLHGSLKFTFVDLMSEFLFPMAVTACICFGLLCNKHSVSETVSIVLCIVWSAVWWMITISEEIYRAVTMPVWLGLLGIAFVFLAAVIYRTLNSCNKCWEVSLNGIEDN